MVSPNYFHSWSYIDGLIPPHLKVHLLHGILEFNKLSVSQNWWLWSEQNTQIVSTNSSSPWPLWSITSWPKFVIFKFGRRGLTFKTPQQGLSDCSLASSFMGHWVRPHKFLSMSGESFMLQEPIRVISESGITRARLVKLGLCKNFSRSREKRRGPRGADLWAHCALVLPLGGNFGTSAWKRSNFSRNFSRKIWFSTPRECNLHFSAFS